MIKRGVDYLAGLRDGRIAFVGSERVDVITANLPGTDFGGRHTQCERFYVGLAIVVRARNHCEFPWSEIDDYVRSLLDRIAPGPLLDHGLAAPEGEKLP